jgi:hypothetical protein
MSIHGPQSMWTHYGVLLACTDKGLDLGLAANSVGAVPGARCWAKRFFNQCLFQIRYVWCWELGARLDASLTNASLTISVAQHRRRATEMVKEALVKEASSRAPSSQHQTYRIWNKHWLKKRLAQHRAPGTAPTEFAARPRSKPLSVQARRTP